MIVTDYINSLAEKVLTLFVWVVPTVLLLAVLAGAVDIVQAYRAQPQAMQCRTQGLEAVRRTFSTETICVRVPSYTTHRLYMVPGEPR